MAALTVRFADDFDARMRFVANVEETSINDLINGAVARYCLAQLADPVFRDKARKHIQRQQTILQNTRADAPTESPVNP